MHDGFAGVGVGEVGWTRGARHCPFACHTPSEREDGGAAVAAAARTSLHRPGGGGGSKDVESNVSVVCVLRIVDLRLSLLRRNEIVTVSLLHVDGTRWVKFT